MVQSVSLKPRKEGSTTMPPTWRLLLLAALIAWTVMMEVTTGVLNPNTLFSQLIVGCNAKAIVVGSVASYNCTFAEECTSSNYRIDVNDMFTAAGKNKPAWLYIEGLDIQGYLFLSVYDSTPRASIIATFIQPKSTTTSIDFAFKISSYFGEGTVITIDGGTFTRKSSRPFFYDALGLRLQDGARVIIKNVVVINFAGVYQAPKLLTLQNGSSFEMYSNTFLIQSSAESTHKSIFSSKEITMSGNSQIVIRDNNITFVGVPPNSDGISLMETTSDSISLSDGSKIIVEGNVVYLRNFVDSLKAVILNFMILKEVSLFSGSSVILGNNTMYVSEVGVKSFSISQLSISGDLLLQEGSSIKQVGNIIEASSLGIPYSSSFSFITTTVEQALTLQTSSSFTIDSNVMNFKGGDTVKSASTGLLSLLGTVSLLEGLIEVTNNDLFGEFSQVTNTLSAFALRAQSIIVAQSNPNNSIRIVGNNISVTPTTATSDAATTSSVALGYINQTFEPSGNVLTISNNVLNTPQYPNATVLTVISSPSGSNLSYLVNMCENTVNNQIFSGAANTAVTNGTSLMLVCNPTLVSISLTRATSTRTTTVTITRTSTPSNTTVLATTNTTPSTITATTSRRKTESSPSISSTHQLPISQQVSSSPKEGSSTDVIHTMSHTTPTPSLPNPHTVLMTKTATAPPRDSAIPSSSSSCPIDNVTRGCELFRRVAVVASINSTLATTTAATDAGGDICGREVVSVPYAVWAQGGGGSTALIKMWFTVSTVPHVIEASFNTSLKVISNNNVERSVLGASRSIVSGDEEVSVLLSVRYAGSTTLSGTKVLLPITIDTTMVACGVGAEGASINLEVTLVGAPPLPADVGTTVNVGVITTAIGGAVIGVPSGLIGTSIAGNMLDMLLCAAFDATAEVDLISNPFSWAVGREELQYQRGSLVFTLILMSGACVVCGVALMGFYLSNRHEGLQGAIRQTRLPSLPLCAVLLACEVAVSPGVSVLLYGGSDVYDYLLALGVLSPLAAFLGMYAYRASLGMRVDIEEVPAEGEDEEGDKRNAFSIVFKYVLEPSHQPVPKQAAAAEKKNKCNGNAASDGDGGDTATQDDFHDREEEENWLRGNYYFVSEKRWAPYGAIEAIVGPLVGVLEGIPLGTDNRAACIARPAAMTFLLTVLVVLLLWRHPFAVRLQQWTGIIITTGLLIASTLVVSNAVSPSEDLQQSAGRVIEVVSIIIMAFGALDVITVLLTLVPSLRVKFGLRSRSLEGSIGHMYRGSLLSSDILLLADQRPDTPETAIHLAAPDRGGGTGSDVDDEEEDDRAPLVDAKRRAIKGRTHSLSSELDSYNNADDKGGKRVTTTRARARSNSSILSNGSSIPRRTLLVSNNTRQPRKKEEEDLTDFEICMKIESEEGLKILRRDVAPKSKSREEGSVSDGDGDGGDAMAAGRGYNDEDVINKLIHDFDL